MNIITYSFPSLACEKHKVESTASTLKFSLRSSGSCLHLLHRLLFPPIVPSITCLEDISCARCDQFTYPSFVLFYVYILF